MTSVVLSDHTLVKCNPVHAYEGLCQTYATMSLENLPRSITLILWARGHRKPSHFVIACLLETVHPQSRLPSPAASRHHQGFKHTSGPLPAWRGRGRGEGARPALHVCQQSMPTV